MLRILGSCCTRKKNAIARWMACTPESQGHAVHSIERLQLTPLQSGPYVKSCSSSCCQATQDLGGNAGEVVVVIHQAHSYILQQQAGSACRVQQTCPHCTAVPAMASSMSHFMIVSCCCALQGRADPTHLSHHHCLPCPYSAGFGTLSGLQPAAQSTINEQIQTISLTHLCPAGVRTHPRCKAGSSSTSYRQSRTL